MQLERCSVLPSCFTPFTGPRAPDLNTRGTLFDMNKPDIMSYKLSVRIYVYVYIQGLEEHI